MESLKERLKQKKQEVPQFQTVQQKKQFAEAEKQRLLEEKQRLERDKEDKVLKKLKVQYDYYKAVEVEKITIKKLSDTLTDKNSGDLSSQHIQLPNSSDLPPIEKKEVQKRLRDIGEPITYFGESDWMRYKRLLLMEQRQNDLNLELAERKTEEVALLDGEDAEEIKSFMTKIKERNLDPNTALVPVFNQMQGKEEIEAYLLEGVSILTRCEDVHLWCKKMLREWNLKLVQKFNTETEKRSLEGSLAFNTYKQTLEYIKPLTEQLQKANLNSQGINEEILNAIYLIVRFCVYKEYVRAHDKYLELAIGNAPWPMGVTMVGIHERTGRSKISSSQIAHILNDETQRKFIQAIKRLITVSQKSYPSLDRSKMVDFRTEYAW